LIHFKIHAQICKIFTNIKYIDAKKFFIKANSSALDVVKRTLNLNNPETKNADYEDDEIELVSKSQLKREMLALTELGEKLCALPLKVVSQFDLDERLFSAYETSQNIHSNIASKRHRQYIGKILRKLPEEVIELLEKQIAEYALGLKKGNDEFHEIEKYRDDILRDGDQAINDILIQYPFLERSHLRQLMRNANKEKEKKQPPKSARLLFKYLKENIRED